MYAFVGLAQACPPCTIASGAQCIPCPDGSDLPECDGCVGGQLPAEPWYARSAFIVPIMTSVVIAVASSLILSRLERR